MNRTTSLYTIGAALLCIIGLLLGLAMCGAPAQINADALTVGTVPVGDTLKPGVIPAQYVTLINDAAHTCPEITAPLLAAQIQQESGFNPLAQSSAGAQGIAQFMPATWAAIGRDSDGDGPADVWDPADAIPAQARYMCDHIAQLRHAKIPGDLIDLALAAYNAGIGAVLHYLGIPPYAETQNYVKSIRQLAASYAQGASTPPTASWVYPIMGTRAICTSGFGPRWGQFHPGLDMAAPLGTPIAAGSSGTVIAAGPATGYGLWVKIQHANNGVTIYGHVDQYMVQVGQRVQTGQQIATVGNQGQSTGSHLHYQIMVNGQAVDPESFYTANNAGPLCGP